MARIVDGFEVLDDIEQRLIDARDLLGGEHAAQHVVAREAQALEHDLLVIVDQRHLVEQPVGL